MQPSPHERKGNMKIADKWTLALRTMGQSWLGIFILLTALGVMGIFFFFAAVRTVLTEKSEPCELKVMAGEGVILSEGTVADILSFPDVLAASGVYEFPVTLIAGDYRASVTVAGVAADYLQVELQSGSMFPENSSMPWLVLSKSTVKAFKNKDGKAGDLNLLDAQTTLMVGEASVIAGVCGICADGEGTAMVYMEQTMAKKLLQQQGLGKSYTYILVRITDMGAAESVTKQISALGCTVETTNAAQQERWSALEKEIVYVLLLGLVLLFCAGMWKYAMDVKQKPERTKQDETLRWVGLFVREIHRLHRTQTLLAVLSGLVLGILVASILPHLLPDNAEESIFALSLWG